MSLQKITTLFKGNSLKAKISRGIAWSFAGTMISKIFLISVFVIIARIVSVKEYGEIGILRNAILTFSMFGLASFGVTATRYIAIYKDKDIDKTNRILTLTRVLVMTISLFISFFIIIFSEQISLYFLNNIALSVYLKYLSIAVFFTSLNGYQNGALAGLEKFKLISLINLINGFLSFPILLIGAYCWSVKGVVIALALVNFLLWIVSFYYLQLALKEAKITLDFRNISQEIAILYKFSLPTFISALMLTPTFFVLNSLLAHQNNGYQQLGIFSAVFFYAALSRTLIQIIGQVLYPYAMKEYGNNNNKFEYINNILPWLVGITINLPLIIFPELAASLFGTKYVNNEFFLSLIFISFSNIVISFTQGISRNIAAANLMWWGALSNLFWAITTILSGYILISYGSFGVSIAIAIGYLFNTLIFIPLYLKLNIISKYLIMNKQFAIIWVLILFCMSMHYMIYSLLYKIIIYFICMFSIYLLVTGNSKEYYARKN